MTSNAMKTHKALYRLASTKNTVGAVLPTANTSAKCDSNDVAGIIMPGPSNILGKTEQTLTATLLK